eukprot:EG_transcript_45808
MKPLEFPIKPCFTFPPTLRAGSDPPPQGFPSVPAKTKSVLEEWIDTDGFSRGARPRAVSVNFWTECAFAKHWDFLQIALGFFAAFGKSQWTQGRHQVCISLEDPPQRQVQLVLGVARE